MAGSAIKPAENYVLMKSKLEQNRDQLAAALPGLIGPERFIRVALTTFHRSPDLLKCSAESLMAALFEAAQLGLTVDGVLGHAYIVPFNDRKRNRWLAQLIPGYKGYLNLAYRSGKVVVVQSYTIHENDSWEVEYGTEPFVKHTPIVEGDPGKPVAYYSVARLAGGGTAFSLMRKDEVDSIRKRSKASSQGPWVTDYEAMAWKSCVRRLVKWLDLSPDASRAVALEELAETKEGQNLAPVEVEAAPAEEQSELDALAEQMEEPELEEPTEEEQEKILRRLQQDEAKGKGKAGELFEKR
jgi:recombination protein RecT